MAGPPPSAPLSPEQLQQLVAPIALYPDSLVAQILAAATYPTQIVEAERFMRENQGLTGQALGQAVDQQDWDPSVKALTQFPSVLTDMDNNLSWTSELGDANYNQPQDVMNAIQYMRAKAQQAGQLQDTPQETVLDDGGDYEIEPADPDVVYVPVYNPEYVYGYPVPLWPGFDPWWGMDEPGISFGMGIGVAPFFWIWLGLEQLGLHATTTRAATNRQPKTTLNFQTFRIASPPLCFFMSFLRCFLSRSPKRTKAHVY